MRGACTPSSVLRSDPPDAHPVFTTSHCFSASDLDLVPPESCFTIPRGTFGDAAAVRCTRLLVAKVVCTDGTDRSFLFTTCRHLSAWNRNNLPLASSVSTARDAYAAADGVRGACTPSSVAYSETPDSHLVLTNGHCIRARSLYPIPFGSSAPTMRDAYAAASRVRCTITPCRDRRLFQTRRTLS